MTLGQSSGAGIITSVASVATVFGVITAIIVGIFQVRRLRDEGRETNGKLDVIHTLVNSTLTMSIESDLASTKTSLDTMESLCALLVESGRPVPPETTAAIAAAKAKIGILTQKMADRLHQAESVLAQEET